VCHTILSQVITQKLVMSRNEYTQYCRPGFDCVTLIVVNCEFVLSAKIRTQYMHYSCKHM